MKWQLTDLKSSDSIRWAVGSSHGRRSSTFFLKPNKKGDFYLSARTLGGVLKTSLHRDGRCHTGLTDDFAKAKAVADRYMDKWTVPLDRLVKAVQIAVAEEDLAEFEQEDKEPMRWLRVPQPGYVTVVGILILPTTQAAELGNSWPGANTGVEPIGVSVLGPRTAYVLHWENPLTATQKTELDALRTRVRSIGDDLRVAPSPALRTILVGQMTANEEVARTLFDVAYR